MSTTVEHPAAMPAKQRSAQQRRLITVALAGALAASVSAAAGAMTSHSAAATSTTSVTSVNDSSFTYTGSWRTSAGGTKFRSDDRYTSSPGAAFSYSFSGTGIKVYASRAPHHGIMGISVDGRPEVKVSLYAPMRADQTLVYTSPLLTPGTHRVVVRATGTKASSSSGTVVNADRVDVLKTTTVAIPTAAPAGGATAPLNEQWDGSYNVTTSTRPWAKEWRGNADGRVSGGELTIPASGDYHRIYHTARRFGGPGKPIVLRMRKRATNIASFSGGTIPSAAIWFRVPKNGVDKNDYRNAFSDNDPQRSQLLDHP